MTRFGQYGDGVGLRAIIDDDDGITLARERIEKRPAVTSRIVGNDDGAYAGISMKGTHS